MYLAGSQEQLLESSHLDTDLNNSLTSAGMSEAWTDWFSDTYTFIAGLSRDMVSGIAFYWEEMR